MDSKNVIAAISLSAAVIIIYGLFFAPPPPDPKKINNEKNNVVESTSEAPSLDQNVEVSKISRNEACLLYTSPSPRDNKASRMPSSA